MAPSTESAAKRTQNPAYRCGRSMESGSCYLPAQRWRSPAAGEGPDEARAKRAARRRVQRLVRKHLYHQHGRGSSALPLKLKTRSGQDEREFPDSQLQPNPTRGHMTIAAGGPSTPSVEGVLTRGDDALQPLSRKRSQSRGHAAEGRGDSVLDLLRVRHFTREPATHGCCSPGPATDVGVHVGLPQQFQIANEAMLSRHHDFRQLGKLTSGRIAG